MFEPLNTSIAGLLFAAIAVPSLSSDEVLVQARETTIEDGKIVLVEQFQIRSDGGASNRVVAAALLRTLSQEIPAAACHLHNNVDVEEAIEELSYSVAKFDAVLLALLNGNEDMGIAGGEARRKTVAELEALIEAWTPIHDAAVAVLDNPSDRNAVDVIYASTEVMLEKTYHLLTEIQSEYSNPAELLQSDLMLIEISARMAMMTQKMAYEACRVWSNEGNDALVADLTETKQIYKASMDALTNGLPALGIIPPPTPEIADSLAAADADWSIIGGLLDRVVTGDPLTNEERVDLYHRLIVKVHKVEEIENLYQQYSKRIF